MEKGGCGRSRRGEQGFFAFEAMPAHCRVITENLGRNAELARRIEIVDREPGWPLDQTLLFYPLGAGSRLTNEGTVSVSTGHNP